MEKGTLKSPLNIDPVASRVGLSVRNEGGRGQRHLSQFPVWAHLSGWWYPLPNRAPRWKAAVWGCRVPRWPH